MIIWLTPENLATFKLAMNPKKQHEIVNSLTLTGEDLNTALLFLCCNQDMILEGNLPTGVSMTQAYCSLIGCKVSGSVTDILTVSSFLIDYIDMRGLTVDLNDIISSTDDTYYLTPSNSPIITDGELEIPSKTVIIDDNAYADNMDLKKVTFGQMCAVINESAFDNCKQLTEVVFNKHLTFIDAYAFRNTSISELHTKPGLRRIGVGAFSDCMKLETVSFNEGLRVIDDDAFRCAPKLKEVILPSSVYYLGKRAFSMDTLLERVNLEGVEYVGDYCFTADRALKELRFSEKLKELGNSFAEGCASLTDIYIPGSIKVLHKDAFNGIPSNCVVHIIGECSDATVLSCLHTRKLKYEVV